MIEAPQSTSASLPPKRGLLGFFAPAPAAPPFVGSEDEVKAEFRYWQRRILISSLIGYALFYFVRKNLSMAMPGMTKDLGITKGDLGLFLTLHGLLYGVSKFANGYLGDRSNARSFMVAGLVLSAICNVFFGFSSAVMAFGIVWMLNGWVQGMGFPPCARLMTHWFSPKELATKMSIWNTSHSIGAGLVVVFCGYLLKTLHPNPDAWRWCFYAPAVIALVGAIFLWYTLGDTPRSVGLRELKETETASSNVALDAETKGFVRRHVFGNPFIWMIALANFFVYALRYAILDWGPTLLSEWKHVSIEHAGWMVASFELAGVAGMLVAGWLTDKIFGGRGPRMCVVCMVMATAAVLLFWKVPSNHWLLNTTLLGAAGFFIYGPQALVGIAAANMATKKAAATAVGFTGLFGYASTLLSGWGLGELVDKHGWDAGFLGMIIVAAIGTLLFALAWPAKAHGYRE